MKTHNRPARLSTGQAPDPLPGGSGDGAAGGSLTWESEIGPALPAPEPAVCQPAAVIEDAVYTPYSPPVEFAEPSIESERGLLGALMLEPAAWAAVQAVGLKAADFAIQAHKTIFRTIEALHGDGRPVDSLIVARSLEAAGKIEQVGGHAAIMAMVDACVTAAYAADYARSVAEAAQRRRLGSAANQWAESASKGASGPELLTTIRAALEAEEHRVSGQNRRFPGIVDAATFTTTGMEAPPEIVAGVMHKGGKAVYGGPSKAFKTWSLLDLCLSVPNGVPWLGFNTHPGRVLYVNFELQSFAVHHRLKVIAKAKRLDIPTTLHLWNLRGHGCPLSKLLPELLKRVEGEGYDLIVPDPIYKTLDGRDENSAGDIGRVCNELESVAVQTGAAVAFGAHFAKGNASGKESIDRISGSGVWARDPDSIIVATPHESDGAFSIEMTLRNFAPPPPFVVRWQYPLMVRDGELDPQRLRQAQRRAGSAPARPDVAELVDGALALVKAKAVNVGVFRGKLYKLAGTQARVRELVNVLVGDGHLEELHARGRGRHEAWIGTPEQIKKLSQRTFDE